MPISRRDFMGGGASSLAIMLPGLGRPVPFAVEVSVEGYEPKAMPSEGQIWDWQVWMNKLGPRYTGNAAHNSYVEFLASNLQSFGLDIVRDHYTFPRWEAGAHGLTVASKGGKTAKIPVASYYPYSGGTPKDGVTGELVYAGRAPNFDMSKDFKGKIVFIDCPGKPVANSDVYTVWGMYDAAAVLPPVIHNAVDQQYVAPMLGDFKKAGAIGIILGWTDMSDAQIAFQYVPFSKPHQDLPGLWVGRAQGDTLRGLAGTGATASLTLEAVTTPDTPTDTLIATLPGMSDEVIIVNTHTDGPNATEENGGIGILALAKYFAGLPKSARKRTLVFVLATGHFSSPYVPSIQGVINKHPDIIKRAVSALAIEHLGARQWEDDASMRYVATGQNEISLAITALKPTADIMLKSLQGSGDNRAAVVLPKTGRFVGEGGALYRAGIPTIGYIPVPSYLLAAPPNGHIDKLDRRLLAQQVSVFAKVIHQMDAMNAAVLKGA